MYTYTASLQKRFESYICTYNTKRIPKKEELRIQQKQDIAKKKEYINIKSKVFTIDRVGL